MYTNDVVPFRNQSFWTDSLDYVKIFDNGGGGGGVGEINALHVVRMMVARKDGVVERIAEWTEGKKIS